MAHLESRAHSITVHLSGVVCLVGSKGRLSKWSGLEWRVLDLYLPSASALNGRGQDDNQDGWDGSHFYDQALDCAGLKKYCFPSFLGTNSITTKPFPLPRKACPVNTPNRQICILCTLAVSLVPGYTPVSTGISLCPSRQQADAHILKSCQRLKA